MERKSDKQLVAEQVAKLPEGSVIHGDLVFGTGIRRDERPYTGEIVLPKGLIVEGRLDLEGCTDLTALPEVLSVGGTLDLEGCTGLKSLPDGLSVRGCLWLGGCKGLTSLPEGLSVGGDLSLLGCTGLTSLPEGLSVGGIIHYSRETGFKERDVPEGLRKKLMYI